MAHWGTLVHSVGTIAFGAFVYHDNVFFLYISKCL